MDPGAPPERRHGAGAILLAALTAALVAGAGAYWLGSASAVTATPGPTSAEAGFARDMQVHHLHESTGEDRPRRHRHQNARMADGHGEDSGAPRGRAAYGGRAWGLRQWAPNRET